MPNHCANQLIVSGPSAQRIKEFLSGHGPYWGPPFFNKAPEGLSEAEKIEYFRAKHFEGEPSPIDLNKIIPVPEEVIAAGYSDSGYYWCYDNWGTKWGCYETSIVCDEEDKVVYQFNTAWAPFKESIFEKLHEVFPDLTFQLDYYETGCGVVGRYLVGPDIELESYSQRIPDDSPVYGREIEPENEDGDWDWEEPEWDSVDVDGKPWEFSATISAG